LEKANVKSRPDKRSRVSSSIIHARFSAQTFCSCQMKKGGEVTTKLLENLIIKTQGKH
jgi:hypothetical protein